MKKTKKAQAPKSRNEPLMRANQGLRSSNAAAPHRNKSKYNRRDTSWKSDSE